MAVSANRLELLQIADAVAREKSIDRGDRHRRHGGRDRQGGALALRRRDRSARRDQSQDRRAAAVAPHARGRQVENPSTQIGLDDAKQRNPAAQVGDTIADAAAAARIWPHRRAIGQAGDRAEGARGRARPAVSGIQGPHRRHRQRHRQARRIRQRRGRSRPRRGDRAPRRDAAARDASATATASAPTSTTCAASRAARRFSCRAPIRSSWPSCSPRRCRKSTTASSR